MKWIKKLFKRKDKGVPPRINKCFIVRYIVGGSIGNERLVMIWGVDEIDVRYKFWDMFDELYHDILDIDIC